MGYKPTGGGGSGLGDMEKATYDTNLNNIVDKSESLDDGAGNVKTAAQVKSHIDSTSNPHSVDKTDVALGNVANVAQIPLSYLDTDGTLTANSDVKVPSQKAIKTYADQLISAANALIYQGVIDCSGSPNYPAANAGDLYVVSVAGKIGGASGVVVDVGDLVLCNTDDTASGDQATVGTKWNVVEKNIEGAVSGPASATDENIVVFDSTSGKIIKDSSQSLTDLTSAISLKHTQGTDTSLGSQAENLDMNSHKITGLSVPSANGDSIRATTKITESNLESVVDSEHTQGTDTGTTGTTFQIDSDNTGPKLKNSSGDLQVRNSADNAYADFVCGDLGDGTNKSSVSNLQKSGIQFMVDGGGAEIETGIAGWVEVPFACTITAVRLLADQSGSIVVDIWKQTYASYPPTNTQTITGSNEPTISSGVKDEDTTLTSWTTSLAEGDILYFNVDSVTTIEKCLISLQVRKA